MGVTDYAVLMGPTGCGKTTVIEIICGLRKPAGGKVIVAGEDVTRSLPGDRQIGYVPQDGALFPTMTVSEQIGFGLEVRREKKNRIGEVVSRLAGELGIEEIDVEIAEDADSMPFVNDLDDSETVEVFPNMPITPLEDGIRISLEKFQQMAQAGELVAEYRQGG